MANNLIAWGVIKDKILLGLTSFGKVYIKMDKENKVTGLYTMFGETQKFVPEENQENLDSAKILMFNIVKNKIERDVLLKKDLNL